jgi:hypothetical protein
LPNNILQGVINMTWEIALGIFALAGFVISIVTIAGKQAGIMAKLEATLKALNETLEELKENNRASHKDIYNKLSDHESRLGEVETKIKIFHDR